MHVDVGQYGKELLQSEIRRGASQIQSAYGVVSLRNIQNVRTALPEVINEGEQSSMQVDGDEGGAEGLAKVQDKMHLRLMRSFEIVLASGHVVRLEVWCLGPHCLFLIVIRRTQYVTASSGLTSFKPLSHIGRIVTVRTQSSKLMSPMQ